MEKDGKRAVELYTLAHQGKNSDGTCSLGECYAAGLGVGRDEARAAALYAEAAQRGSARGAYLLGGCYEQGLGVGKDLDKARELYRQAADKKHQKAQEALERLSAGEAAQPKPGPAPATGKPEQQRGRRGWWPFGRK